MFTFIHNIHICELHTDMLRRIKNLPDAILESILENIQQDLWTLSLVVNSYGVDVDL